MLDNLIATVFAEMSLGEKFLLGLEISFIGMLVVFVILLTLVAVTTLFKKLIYDKSVKINETPKEILAPVIISEDVSSDDMNIAAITAALAVALEGEANDKPNIKFIVRSIKKF